MEILTLERADSTNSWVASHEHTLADMTVVRAIEQTQGRGQRGNSWESQPNMNLTFSMIHRPEQLEARRQFGISEAVALGVVDMLSDYSVEACVKWPNDIYVGDGKICGILIENSITDRWLTRCIIGVGININQEKFMSDAPNPVSLRQLTGSRYDLEEAQIRVARHIERRLLLTGPSQHEEYLQRLWRRDGYYPYRAANDNEIFEARIADIAPDGYLTLERRDGTAARYAFKEVAAVI